MLRNPKIGRFQYRDTILDVHVALVWSQEFVIEGLEYEVVSPEYLVYLRGVEVTTSETEAIQHVLLVVQQDMNLNQLLN